MGVEVRSPMPLTRFGEHADHDPEEPADFGHAS
jgi:hypothetical protein